MRTVFSFMLALLTCSMLCAQSRVAIDLNATFLNRFMTLQYCPIIKKGMYIKSGITFGTYGIGYEEQSQDQINADEGLISPYSVINTAPIEGMFLIDYITKIKGVGIELGLGKFWEIDPVHTIRLDLQVKVYRFNEEVSAHYTIHQPSTFSAIQLHSIQRNCLSIGPELFHAIRISGRITGFYGFKFPFFLPIRTAGYKPQSWNDVTVGFQPNLTVGMSCALGKKNKTMD